MTEKKSFELNPSIAILMAGVLIAGAILVTNGKTPTLGAAAAGQVATIDAASIRPPTAGDHIIGSPNAPIVLVEYSDFQCPYCSMIYPTLKRIVDESNGGVAWIYREFPLTSIHPQALPAAHAAECIAKQLGNDGFWKYADAVFNNQAKLTPDYSASLAKQFGADMTAYNQCVSSSEFGKVIDSDTAEAEGAGGTGTPFTVVINTKTGKAAPVSGALPYAQLMSVIKALQ
ncbi:MAG TPA: DsbA family protein [Candidatus Paceibacterota bacterium]|nr:DsbA family protein [Candidatus Paceibacterota bacterium]